VCSVYRARARFRLGPAALSHAGVFRGRHGPARRTPSLSHAHHGGRRRSRRGFRPGGAAHAGDQPGAHSPAGLRPVARDRGIRGRAADRHRSSLSVCGPYLHRPRLRCRRAGGHGVDLRRLCRRTPARSRRDLGADPIRRVMGDGRVVRPRIGGARGEALRPVREGAMTGGGYFWAGCALAIALAYGLTLVVSNEYPFFAGYVVIQFVLLATAWNIAGGYAGYVNFG